MSEKKEDQQPFVNPIDKDNVAENPGLLPYAHTVGGFVIKPIDEGRMKGKAIRAMEQQTDMQMAQLYKQMELLAAQAEKINQRKIVSEKIYGAEMSFKPLIGHSYHLYIKENEAYVLSLISKNEWGRRGMPYSQYVAKVTLLADHTWDLND